MAWIVAGGATALVAALVWWSSGRARPARRNIETSTAINRGRTERSGPRGPWGPS